MRTIGRWLIGGLGGLQLAGPLAGGGVVALAYLDRPEPETPAAVVHEVEFGAVVEPSIEVPRPGGETGVRLALRITNRSDQAIRFRRIDAISLTLTSPTGQVLAMDGGRNKTLDAEAITERVTPGSSVELALPARLLWSRDGRLRLIGPDAGGGTWYVDGLARGSYALRITYENRATREYKGDPVWRGKSVTRSEEMVLR